MTDTKKSSTTTQTSNTDPWSGAQPALKYGMGEALDLYKGGVGNQPFTGSTVTPYSDQSINAFGSIDEMSKAYMDGPGASGHYDPGTFGGQTGNINQLQDYSSGKFLDGRNNTEFQKVLQQTQDDVWTKTNMNAAAAGRYGSPTHSGEVARNVGNITSQALSNNYQNEVNNMFNAGQQLPASFQAALQPAVSQLGVGGAMEDLYNREIQDKVRIFDDTQNKPWNDLTRFMAIAGGAGQLGGNGTSTTSTPKDWSTNFGNILSGAGYLGSTFLGG